MSGRSSPGGVVRKHQFIRTMWQNFHDLGLSSVIVVVFEPHFSANRSLGRQGCCVVIYGWRSFAYAKALAAAGAALLTNWLLAMGTLVLVRRPKIISTLRWWRVAPLKQAKKWVHVRFFCLSHELFGSFNWDFNSAISWAISWTYCGVFKHSRFCKVSKLSWSKRWIVSH